MPEGEDMLIPLGHFFDPWEGYGLPSGASSAMGTSPLWLVWPHFDSTDTEEIRGQSFCWFWEYFLVGGRNSQARPHFLKRNEARLVTRPPAIFYGRALL